ncbi:MAG: NADP-dependent oxidoreductase, partial [Streptosporangiaceae bacterium]
MPVTGREVRLAARPQGEPTPSDFALAEAEVPDPGPDQVVVRNLVMSVDPYMRGRMNEGRSYVPPFRLGEPLEGGAVGEVVESRSPELAPGAVVLHNLGWREYAVMDARGCRAVDTALAPASAYLSVLGMPGFTAYVGLLDIAGMRAGDVVFVSAAAGTVGS